MGSTVTVQGKLTSMANDTFIQLALTTGLSGSDNTAFRIKEIVLDYPSMGANVSCGVQLTRGSKAALVDFSDASLIFRDARSTYQSASGAMFQDLVKDIVPQGDIIVVESQIYLGWKTTAFAALASIGYRIVFEEVKINADTRIAILSQRLP